MSIRVRRNRKEMKKRNGCLPRTDGSAIIIEGNPTRPKGMGNNSRVNCKTPAGGKKNIF